MTKLEMIEKKIKDSRNDNFVDGWEERLDLFFDKVEIIKEEEDKMKAQVEIVGGVAIEYDWYRMDGQETMKDIKISSIEIEEKIKLMDDVEVFEIENGKRHRHSADKQLPALLAVMSDGLCKKVVEMVDHDGDFHIYMMVVNVNGQDIIWQVQGWMN